MPAAAAIAIAIAAATQRCTCICLLVEPHTRPAAAAPESCTGATAVPLRPLPQDWESEEEEEERLVWHCMACEKYFKSEAAYDNHQRARKHLQQVWRLGRRWGGRGRCKSGMGWDGMGQVHNRARGCSAASLTASRCCCSCVVFRWRCCASCWRRRRRR